MQLSVIAAIARNRVMGRDNQLPWHLPADLRRFKAVTMGKPILMGRRTYTSIGRPLPGRTNVVLTRDPTFVAAGVVVASSLTDALARVADEGDEAFVIGGAALFAEALPQAQRLYLTIIEADFDGDVYFPPLRGNWRLVSEERCTSDDKNPWPYRFLLLEAGPPNRDAPTFDLDRYLAELGNATAPH